ncbi:MAG: glycerophosphodiester phosphodiesterase [Candidatus Saccharimonadales bacterium]
MKQKNQPASFWENTRTPVAVAHRGGNAAGAEKENSLKAFQAAYKLGYRYFETDVVPTKDNVLLAIHGRGLDKNPNKDLPYRFKIQRMTHEEIAQSLRIGGEQPITLAELLDNFPGVKLFIDPKTFKAGSALAEFLISRPDDLSRVCVGSFHGRNTRLIKQRVRRATGVEVSCAAIGKLRGFPVLSTAKFPPLTVALKLYGRLYGVEVFQLPYKLLIGSGGTKIVETAHRNGFKIAAYTPNNRSSIEAVIISGVDAVISDEARILKEIIKH